jgi:hypothetical protein
LFATSIFDDIKKVTNFQDDSELEVFKDNSSSQADEEAFAAPRRQHLLHVSQLS